MVERKKISIEEALKNSEMKTFEKEDKKAKKSIRGKTQVSIYFNDEEIKYIDEICQRDMISRVTFVRRMLRQEMNEKQ